MVVERQRSAIDQDQRDLRMGTADGLDRALHRGVLPRGVRERLLTPMGRQNVVEVTIRAELGRRGG
jgi:hypothetical protein